MKRPLLSQDNTSPAAQRAQAGFHASVVEQVRAATERDPVVVVGMAQNPVVKRARAGLDAAGIPFTYLPFGSYMSGWKERLAIKLWSGWPTFPQVFVGGTLIGGNKELAAMLEDGSLQRLLEAGDEG